MPTDTLIRPQALDSVSVACRHLALIVGGASALAVAAQIKIPLPWAPGIPFTLQTLAVMLLAVLLGPWRGSAAVLVYLAAGIAGLGVFTVTNPVLTAGYLVAFLPAAVVLGLLARRGLTASPTRAFFAMALAGIGILALGALWLSFLANAAGVNDPAANPITLASAWTIGFLWFVPIEIAKAALAAAALQLGRTTLNSARSRNASR